MVNKKGMWFLTLFSLILVLGVYYATMPKDIELDSLIDKDVASVKKVEEEDVSESSILVALRVEKEEEMLNQMNELNDILTSKTTSVEEKNTAFEKMKNLNTIKAEEEQIEASLKKELNIDCFVRVIDDKVKVSVTNQDQSIKLANQIMNCVKKSYNNIYVTVEFK